MAIDFGNTTGSLFASLGKVGAVIANLTSHQTTQQTAMATQATGIVGQLNAEPDVQAIVGQGYLSVLSSLGGSTGSLMSQVAAAIANRIVYRDSPRLGQTLTNSSTLESLKEIIRQMKEQGATVRAHTVAATPGTFSPIGNGVLVASTKRPFDGLVLENLFAETINCICTRDSYVGSATSGNELITVTGGGGTAGVYDFNWPLGSGLSSQLSAIDGSKDNSTGNVLTNSGWDDWTANLPDNWSLLTGTYGTNFQQNTGTTYDGVSSLEFIGDGTNLVGFDQIFNSTVGTTGVLNPLNQYSFNLWLKRDGVAPAAGALRISLVDSGGNVIKDAANVDNSYTIDLTTSSTTWTAYNVAFRTPLILPSSVYLRVRLSTALTTGRSVYVDRMSLGAMTQLYTSGPFLACHSGNAPFAIGDLARVTCTNSRGSGGTLNTWQTFLARAFPEVLASELLFPSSGAPSVLDAWLA